MNNLHPSSDRRRITGSRLTILSTLFLAFAAFSQTPPPNDNYSNSITLTGTDIIFSGTLAGATVEDSQEAVAYNNYEEGFIIPTQSIWWNWTAPSDTVLTLQILNPTNNSTDSGPVPYKIDMIVVYTATNGSLNPAGLSLPALGTMPDIVQLTPQTLSLPVAAGSNYQIQLIGNSSVNYNIHLVATNTPVIITQPRSQTVYSNASATFYVVYAGLGSSNFTFQWYLNGTNLPGETAPMLALTNINSSMAGNYTVAVSNSAGATLSAPATLAVSQSRLPVSLTAIGNVSNSFMFSLAGELGRTYHIETSTDLSHWVPEADFPSGTYTGLPSTDIFFETNVQEIISAQNGPSVKYFRILPYVTGSPDAEICINNLRQIRIAKLLWQRDYNVNVPVNATPQSADLVNYFPHHALPFCPKDAQRSFDISYSINNFQSWPICEISPTNHILMEPQ